MADNTKKETISHPDHVPIVPPDVDLVKAKEDARKLEKKLRESGATPEPIVTTIEGKTKKASDLTVEEQESEYIRCATSAIYFIETYLTIFDQTKGDGGQIVPFKLFEFQKKLIKTYIDDRFVVANKYRQAGISTATCAYIAWYVMFNKNRSVAMVADKLETAVNELMNDVVDFIEDCPSFLVPSKKKDTQKLKRYSNGCQLGAFSSKGLRGYTPTLLFWDETAWTENGDKFWTSAKPTLQTGGRAIFVSTPNGLDPVFYKTFDAARREDDHPFTAVELWWFNDPRYNEGLKWIKNKEKENEKTMIDRGFSNDERIKLHDDGWFATSPWFEDEVKGANGDMRKIAQEILCSFLGSGDNFIAEEYLQRIEENEIKTPLRQEYLDHCMWIWEDPDPNDEYLMTIDAAAGHGDDNSTINIFKLLRFIEEKYMKKNGVKKKVKIRRTKFVQVAEYYGKLTPQLLAQIAYQYGIRYNNAYTVVDITGGYGIHTIEKLIEIGYPTESIHYAEVTHKPSRDRLSGYIRTGQKQLPDGSMIEVDLIPGFFIGNNRPSVLIEMQRAIHLEDVIIRSVRLLGELKTFVTVPGNRVADHKRSFHDDSIMGMAIGIYSVNFDLDKFNYSKEKTKKVLDAMLKINDKSELQKIEDKLKNKNPEEFKKIQNVRRSKSANPDLRTHIAHSWLFKGLKS